MSPTKKTNDDAANARRKSENLRSPSEATESPRRATDAKKAASAAHDATVASRGATKKPSAAKKRTPATKAPPAKKRTPAKAAPASTEADQTPREAETAPAEAQVAYTPTGQAVPIEQRKHFRLPIDVVRILNAAVVEAAIKETGSLSHRSSPRPYAPGASGADSTAQHPSRTSEHRNDLQKGSPGRTRRIRLHRRTTRRP